MKYCYFFYTFNQKNMKSKSRKITQNGEIIAFANAIDIPFGKSEVITPSKTIQNIFESLIKKT